MPDKAQAKDHAHAMEQAADFIRELARRNELPLTEKEFNERVEAFYASLKKQLSAANALLLAVIKDEPCPQSLFEPWASAPTIWQWRTADAHPLQSECLNGKVMIRPSAFFAALKFHGKPKVSTK
jgi:hypothetical protein